MVYDLGRNVEICSHGGNFNASGPMVYLVLPYPLKVPIDKWVLGIGFAEKSAHFGKRPLQEARQSNLLFGIGRRVVISGIGVEP